LYHFSGPTEQTLAKVKTLVAKSQFCHTILDESKPLKVKSSILSHFGPAKQTMAKTKRKEVVNLQVPWPSMAF